MIGSIEPADMNKKKTKRRQDLPIDAGVEETGGRLLNKEITIEPSKVTKDLKDRDGSPNMQRD